MSIRGNRNTKDNLRGAATLMLAAQEPASQTLDPLRFWTSHPKKKTFVDLTPFRDGQKSPRRPINSTRWKGPFQGRPELIDEMAPIIRDHAEAFAEKSIYQLIVALRSWWRLLDEIESEAPDLHIVTSTAHLSALHGQRGLTQSIGRLAFNTFLLLANKTRAVLGLKPLYWQRQATPTRHRKLPPQWQTDLLRHELKHRWFSILDRWSLADALLATGKPVVCRESQLTEFARQSRLLEGYQFLAAAIVTSGHPRPSHLWRISGTGARHYYDLGHDQLEMLQGRYPTGDDVKTALLLCLATTGWNPAVLLNLNVDEKFVEAHPKDPARYILRGYKARGGTEQISEGLLKTQGSAAAVLTKLIERTEPLRAHLKIQVKKLHAKLASIASTDVNALKEEIEHTEEIIRSPWLYVSLSGTGIHCLANHRNKTSEFLIDFIQQINIKQSPNKQLEELKPTDLRDAYAAHAYNINGGSILAVMKALRHRRISSTQIYVDNTLLAEIHRKLYATFSAGLWHEIQVHRRVDPAVLAKWSRDGIVTSQERERLHSYRDLLRSRIGIGCKDSKNPPRHIAPEFVADGKSDCHVQRCLLCSEHAVIFPDSVAGICKRLAELRHIRERMSLSNFSQSSFSEELDNAEAVLLVFSQQVVSQHLKEWTDRIAQGKHRVIEFDGMYRHVTA